MSIKIGWTPCGNSDKYKHNELTHDTPELVKLNMLKGGFNYCPATHQFYKNVYAVKMPYNITIGFSDSKPFYHLSKGVTPTLLDDLFHATKDEDGGVTIQIHLNNMFVSDTRGVEIETLPPILHGCREEIIYLNGIADIYSWQRSLHFGFKVPKETVQKCQNDGMLLEFNKGEVVQYFRVRTPNNETTKLVVLGDRSLPTLQRYADRCESITQYIMGFNLKEVLNRVTNRRPKKFIKD